jgi:ABC-type transporter Mla MlaB component
MTFQVYRDDLERVCRGSFTWIESKDDVRIQFQGLRDIDTDAVLALFERRYYAKVSDEILILYPKEE